MNFFDFMNNLHLDSEVITEKGSHGIRYFNGVLQVFINGKWIDASAKAEVIDVEISKEDFDAILESGEVLEGVDYHIMGVQGGSVVTVSNPNLLINPDFRINQRGVTPESWNELGSWTYGVDRWAKGTNVKFTSFSPMTLTALSASEGFKIFQKLEIMSSITTPYTLSAKINDKVYSCTFTLDSLSKGNEEIHYFNDYGIYFQILLYPDDNIFAVCVGSNVGNSILTIEWVKLEEGSVATPFLSPEPATELMKCQRYYERIETNCYSLEKNFADGLLRVTIPYKVTKRVVPTVNILKAINNGGYTFYQASTIDNVHFWVAVPEPTYLTSITCFEADAEIY